MLATRIRKIEEHLGRLVLEGEAAPLLLFFAVRVDLWSNGDGQERYVYMDGDPGPLQEASVGTAFDVQALREFQAAGATVLLAFDEQHWSFDLIERGTLPNGAAWARAGAPAWPNYRAEHLIEWTDYRPGDCLARAMAASSHAAEA